MRARAAILLLALGAEPAIAGAAGSVLVQQSLEGQPLHGEERRVFEIPLTAGEYVEATIREGDLSQIGNGTPTVVQIHDPQCPRCVALVR